MYFQQMFARAILIATAVQTGFQGRVPDAKLFTWWIASPLEKIKPTDPVPPAPSKDARLHAGRNEFEPFQIVLRPEGTDVAGIDIEFSDLRSIGGAEISNKNVTVYLEVFLTLTQPSSVEGGTGLWPDPLIPRTDRYANERRNAFPFDVRHDQNQPLWVEIFVPEHTAAGNYTGTASIFRRGRLDIVVPIHLTVWGFTVPSTSPLKSSFGLNGTTLLKQHRGRYTNDAELYGLTRSYAKAALMHRLTIYGGSMVPPKHRYTNGRMLVDWSDYDAEVGPFLDGAVIPRNEPLYGAKATSAELRTPSSFESPEEEAAYRAEWMRHFQKRGWGDRLFLYLWDEPARRDFPKVLQRGRASLGSDPKVRNLVTAPFAVELKEVVQIWTPLVNCLERKPGFDDFCAWSPKLDVYASEIRQGKSLWFYQSCASHGCNIQGGQYFTGWPNYMVDMPGAANRVMQWVAWKYGIEGELYFNMDEAYGQDGDPWVNIRLFGGNGDGTLFYPGRPSRIGGHTDIPIESIRLKLIREGMEDYAYLALLARLGGDAAARKFVDRIVQTPYRWESRPEAFLKIRQELGETLQRLVTLHAETEANAQ